MMFKEQRNGECGGDRQDGHTVVQDRSQGGPMMKIGFWHVLSPEGGRDSAKQNFAASPRGYNIPRQFSLVGYAFINNPEVSFWRTGRWPSKLASLSSAPGSWYLRFVETERLADLANPIRAQAVARSCQWQIRGPPLAVDRQMSMTLAAPMSSRIEMAPALCQPLSERIDFH
jgi:hypothetical protein